MAKGRDIPFPNQAAAAAAIQKQISEQVTAIVCDCGNPRFKVCEEVLLMHDRIKPSLCGPAPIQEFTCVKCGQVYETGPSGFQKQAKPSDNGGGANG